VLRAARISVAAVFLIHGMIVSNWLSRIPAVKQTLGLSVSALGVALLGSSVGALVAMALISRLIARVGSARVTRWSTFAFCAVLPLPALARGPVTLTLFLVVYGAMAGCMEVAMNTQAVDVERRYARPMMVGFHALFSLGGMTGAGIGGVAASLGIAPWVHLPVAAIVLATAAIFATRSLLIEEKEPQAGLLVGHWSFRPILGLAAIAFCILLGEGAMADWSAVYLNRFTGQGVAAAGYSVFSLTMAAGRLSGDWLRARVGSVLMVRAGSALAAVGLGSALVAGSLIPALIGFACAGAGWASIFPIVSGAAGHKSVARPEAGVAAVSATGFFAFLVGPPLIGFIAQAWTLRTGLAVVVLLSALASIMAGVVRNADAGMKAG
jgi:MFS family permease